MYAQSADSEPRPKGAVPELKQLTADNLRNQLSIHVRQPHIPPIKQVRKPLMVHAEQMQDRRMQIVNGNGLLLGLVAEFIARSDGLPALNASARHPHAHGSGIVIAAHAAL